MFIFEFRHNGKFYMERISKSRTDLMPILKEDRAFFVGKISLHKVAKLVPNGAGFKKVAL